MVVGESSYDFFKIIFICYKFIVNILGLYELVLINLVYWENVWLN